MNYNDDEVTIWGPWSTTGIGFLILIGFLIAQTVGAGIYVLVRLLDNPNVDFHSLAGNALEDGLLLSISVVAGSLVGCVLVSWAVWNKTQTFGQKYLALTPVRARTWIACCGMVLVLAVIFDVTTHLLERPIVPEFMAASYSSMSFKPLLWFAICLAGPVFEELFFRGFLVTGWMNSKLGPLGAVVLSATVWTLIHLQYGPYELVQVFVLGLLFGSIRVWTGSLLPAIGGHIFANVIATVETAILSAG